MTDFSNVKAICFDVDSTVCVDEGIDMLATYCGRAELVQNITTEAMEGRLDFTTALERRLEALELSKNVISTFLEKHPVRITPGAEELFASLRSSKIELFLVSGGIYELVSRVARHMNVPTDHVFANRLIYDTNGRVIDFDRTQPTSRSDGKRDVVAMVKSQLPEGAGVLMVGDGLTDAAACPPADAFLGFGGVIARPVVQRATPFFFWSFDELHNFLLEKGVIHKPT
ncbi:unnamed protein product [Mesocestoides corti]|uniref:Phosphoserine phosphatase n=1 Tax=Mesocestoides corti TaxID=53468 RepID=A0A0R3UFQ4_MESCO|nr:unnamed protein product [Mesocestoides corti]